MLIDANASEYMIGPNEGVPYRRVGGYYPTQLVVKVILYKLGDEIVLPKILLKLLTRL